MAHPQRASWDCQHVSTPPHHQPPPLPLPLVPPAPQGYGNQKFVFQGVHETICYGPGEKPWADDEPRINQIVFIGRGLNRKSLMMGFK